MEKECKRKCPFCNSEDIHYGTIKVVDKKVYYPAQCEDCKKIFREYYNLTYCETIREKCHGCDDRGYILSYRADEKVNEIQRCDECMKYKTDGDAATACFEDTKSHIVI